MYINTTRKSLQYFLYLNLSFLLAALIFSLLLPVELSNTFGQNSQNMTDKQGMKTYENKYYGIKFEYPSDAFLQEDSFMTMTFHQPVYLFLDKKFSEPSIIFKVNFLTPDENTLDQANTKILNELKSKGNTNKNITILKSEPTTFAGLPGHQIEYLYSYSYLDNNLTKNIEKKIFSIWSQQDDLVFEIKFNGNIQNYNQYFPIVKKLVSSFQIMQ